MQDIVSEWTAALGSKLGRCAVCMRQSLALATASWVAVALCSVVWPGSLLPTVVSLLALGLTALWTLHITVYAARAVFRAHADRPEPHLPGAVAAAGHPAATGQDARLTGRREALGVFARAVGIGLLASTPVILWSTRASAFCGQCTIDDDCGGSANGWCCKNTAPVNAGYVCNECVSC